MNVPRAAVAKGGQSEARPRHANVSSYSASRSYQTTLTADQKRR
jgi:hypothetical protein